MEYQKLKPKSAKNRIKYYNLPLQMLKHYLQRLNLKTSKKRNKANQRLILRQKFDHFYRLQTIVRLKEVR